MTIECAVQAQEEVKYLRGGSPPPFCILVEANLWREKSNGDGMKTVLRVINVLFVALKNIVIVTPLK